MSEENVDVLRASIEAVNRQDADAFVATVAPDVEWHDSAFWSEVSRIYRGKAEVREWFNQIVLEPWESLHCGVEEITEAPDDRIFFGGLLTARGEGSGVDTELRFWTVNWIADGKITRRKVFLDKAEALEAAGLPE